MSAHQKKKTVASCWLLPTVRSFFATVIRLCVVATPLLGSEKSPEQFDNFEKQVRPLLIQKCLECHSAKSKEIGGNLQLDSRLGWTIGGDLGPAIIPGKPSESLLIKAVRHTHEEVHMPPDGKLAEQDIRILEDWIESGAPDPRDAVVTPSRSQIDIDKGREHWAFQTPHGRDIPRPHVNLVRWPKNEIDLFVLSKLEQNRLTPAKQTDKLTLVRRATFDLTGLPPSPHEIRAFLDDESPDAYLCLVERLLSSPRYGERWGRFWLDVARYADSNGLDENVAYGNAWRYRDYVLSAFNRDRPYDRFVLEQLAGDLLPPSNEEVSPHEHVIATGFLSLGPKVLAEVDETKMEMDIIDEQVETVGRAFMGLTLGCARCHDHKFDPIPTDDYYALAGIFKSTKTMEHFTKIARWNEVAIASESDLLAHATQFNQVEAKKAEIKKLTEHAKEYGEAIAETNKEVQTRLKQLQAELAQLESDVVELPTAMSVTEYDQATDLRVHIRGSFLTLGSVVARGFPVVLVSSNAGPVTFGPSESGRLQLAQWLVDGRHPLVARVLVNRIWRWHFGRGLVKSTDNFGKLGTLPDNQPLLDWLANRFVSDGWSIKNLHRLIMLSSTYQMSSNHDDANSQLDEENRFHWRANMLRLEAEAIRDSILSVSGQLDLTSGGSLLHVKNREFLFDHTSKDETKYDSQRRSVYLPVIRNHLYDAFQLFDYADASVTNSNRTTTTVAPQALYMMNSEFVLDAAMSFAKRVCDHSPDQDQRIRFAYEVAYGRPSTAKEIARAKQYLNSFGHESDLLGKEETASHRVWVALCQTLMMSNEFIHIK